MRTSLRLVAVFAISIVLAGGARADLLNLASGTLDWKVGPLPPVSFGAASVPISVSSGGGSFTEPAGIFSGSVMLPTALFTGVPLLDGLTLASVANGTKVVAQGAAGGGQATGILRAGGGLGGPGPLDGTLIVNVLSLFNLVVPLDPIGSTGATTSVTAGVVKVTILGTGWTTGTVTLTGLSTTSGAGGQVNNVTFVGYDNRSPGHAGSLLLISPFKVIATAAGNLAGLATQSLTFVPEPETLLLLAGGCVALGLHGLRGRRRS